MTNDHPETRPHNEHMARRGPVRRRDPGDAVNAVIERARTLGWGTYLHVRLRMWSHPVSAILDSLGSCSTVVEFGCGYGVLLVAIDGIDAIGFDHDESKIEAARALDIAGNVDFRVGGIDQFEEFCCSSADALNTPICVLLNSVAYLCDDVTFDRFLAAASLISNTIVISDVDSEPTWKARVSRAQEWVSTRVLRITDGEAMHFRGSSSLRSAVANHFEHVAVIAAHHHRIHSHVLVIGRSGAMGRQVVGKNQ